METDLQRLAQKTVYLPHTKGIEQRSKYSARPRIDSSPEAHTTKSFCLYFLPGILC